MPKESNKKGKRKKTTSQNEAGMPKAKKCKTAKKPTKVPIVDEIGKSKQLSTKLKTSTRRVRKNRNNPEHRMSANGKLMPSLAELERMFEGSDDDEEIAFPAAPSTPERCKTPVQPILPDPKKLLTPKTIQEISNKVSEIISTLTVIPDDAPPLPVVPQEHKRKKGEPYIVGCKERPKIPDAPFQTVIGRAWDKYGIDYNFKRNEDQDEEPKGQKGSGSLSKSIFNPKSEEIAAMLESSEILSDGSVDSNKTVPYEYSSLSPKLRTFSPLPSTSKDNETILMNDLRFNESLLGDSVSNDSPQHSDVEVIEMPCETIMVDDDAEESDVSHVPIKSQIEEIRYDLPTFDTFETDAYSSIVIDLDQTYDNSDCEIVDVDEVLAENKSIIDKYEKERYTSSVTHVELGAPTQQKTVLPKQEPIVLDEVDPSPGISFPSTRDKIESIVTNYFKQKSPNDQNESAHQSLHKQTPQNTPVTETIDLSDSYADNSTFKNMMNSFLQCAKSLMESWTKNNPPKHASSARKRRLPVVIDTIDLDQSSFGSRNNSNHSDVSANPKKHPNQSSSGNPNDNSVIIVSNLNVNVTPQKQKLTKKGKSRKKAPIATPEQCRPVATASSTPVGRTIGDCPICMDNLSNKALASTICGHIFCMSCIQAAIKASGKRCPTCRKVLKGAGYHQLFL